MVKELDLKALTTAKESLETLAGGGTLGTINSIMGNINELLKSGLTLWNTMSGQQRGQFQPLSQLGQPAQSQQPQQPTGTQTTLNPAPAQGLNAESVFKSISDVLGLLSVAKPDMTVKQLLAELKTNKASVMEGIQKGMGGGSVKPKS